MSVYDPLANYLEPLDQEETELSFREVEAIIGRPLPASARKRPAWWANDPSHCIGKLMIERGMKVEHCNIAAEKVTFRKLNPDRPFPSPEPKPPRTEDTSFSGNSLSHQTWGVCLISCVSMKREGTHPAKDFYTSPLFLKSRIFAERFAKRWFILSAKYGLVSPDSEITTYDQTLKTMSLMERKQWADLVLTDLKAQLIPGETLVILAGNTYTKNLIPELIRCKHPLYQPLEGLRMGERLARLDELNHA